MMRHVHDDEVVVNAAWVDKLQAERDAAMKRAESAEKDLKAFMETHDVRGCEVRDHNQKAGLLHVPMSGCRCCAGRLATIRGRHPGEPDRQVCPTCLVEKYEDFMQQLTLSWQTPKLALDAKGEGEAK